MKSTIFLFILSAFPFCSAIECYFCTTASDPRCSDVSQFPAQSTSLQPMECQATMVDDTLSNIRKDIPSPEEYNYNCIKIETRAAYGNKTEIIRGCINAASRRFDPCGYIREHLINQNDLSYCGECKYYGCNSAPSMKINFAVFTITTALLSRSFG